MTTKPSKSIEAVVKKAIGKTKWASLEKSEKDTVRDLSRLQKNAKSIREKEDILEEYRTLGVL